MVTERVGGDLLGFEQTVRTDSRLLYSVALSILGDRQEAEDAVQDSMELAWKSWNSIRDPQRRTEWLKRICVHRCLRIRRGLRGFPLLSQEDRREDARQQQTRDPDLDRAFLQLSPAQRAVLTLHFHHGYSLDECAHLMGCRPGTARSHLGRGLASLRKELSDV